MKGKLFIILAVVLIFSTCRSYDISSLIFQDDLKRQIAAGNLRIRINDEQIPYVIDLLLDEDPLIRYAALKIIENNRNDEFLDSLLETTLDEDERVLTEAFRILEAYPQWTVTFLEENLSDMGDLLCLNSLLVLGHLGLESSIPAMVNLFSVDSEKKKNGAARTLADLLELDSELMSSLKISEDPNMRSGYFRIVAHYEESTLIPLLFEGIGDSSTDVWGACVSGIYGFGEAAFPFVDRYIKTDDYLMSLSCLQILEAVKSEKSLPLLISMYGNANQLLAQKSAIIVKAYGEGAVPYLFQGISDDSLMTNRLILWTLREIDSVKALPFFLELLDLQDPLLLSDLLLSLSALGESVFPQIRLHVQRADPAVAKVLLTILIEENDPLIIDDDICSYYLIKSTEDDYFESYFALTDIRPEVEEDFRNLRRALTYETILNEAAQGDNLYFVSYRESIALRFRAEESLESSLRLRREYLGSRNENTKVRSDELLQEYEGYIAQAEVLEQKMTQMSEGVQKRGEALIFQYLQARRDAVDIWVGISPRFRNLAGLIYNEMDEDIEVLLQEVSRE